MSENKQEILNSLASVLKLTRAGQNILKIDYQTSDNWEDAVICFKSGGNIRVYITADSGVAMIHDIIKRL